MKKTLLIILLGGLAGNVSAWVANPATAFTAGNILVPAIPGIVVGLVALFVPSPAQNFLRNLFGVE